MLRVDRYAYTNRLYRVHPGEKLGFALATMAVCLFSPSPLTHLAVIFLMAALSILAAGIPARFFFKLMLIPVGFLLVGVVAVVVAVSPAGEEQPLWWGVEVGGFVLGVTVQGLDTACRLFLKSLGAVNCLYFLSLTTPAVEIFSVLRKLRLPPLFVELMALVYRFIFVLLETAAGIYTSQASRLGYSTVKRSFRSLGQLVACLFTKSYYHSQMLYTSLLARCYKGELSVLEQERVLSKTNLVMIAAVELVLLVVSWWSGDLRLFLGGAGH